MESLLLHLISHIKEALPTLSMVDEDCGQLEALDNDNRYPQHVTSQWPHVT